jgi:rhodanese-related sulfurtransferase
MEGMSVEELVELARSRLSRLTAARAAQARARGALIIDIRCACQRQRDGLVPGAIGIERNVLEWRADPRSPWRDPRLSLCRGPLILMCAQGYQSSLAAASLHDLGITHATDLIDGFEGWREAGLPVHAWPGDDRPGVTIDGGEPR